MRVELTKAGIEISFQYRAYLVDAVKKLPVRRWNPEDKVWMVPATAEHARYVMAFAERENFHCDPRIFALAEGNGETFKALPSSRTVTIDNDQAWVRFPVDRDLGDAIKRIPGRSW